MLLVATFVVAGCGKSGLDRVRVSGEASYRGQPIEMGQIRFVPIPPTMAPITVELIRDGKYTTVVSGGVPVGTHRVELRMYDPEEYRNAPRTPGTDAVKQLLPDKYNRASELTITVDSGSRAMKHDFLLEE